MLVTQAAFNSVVRGERHSFFTTYSKNPGNLYDNVNGKTILARPTGNLLNKGTSLNVVQNFLTEISEWQMYLAFAILRKFQPWSARTHPRLSR